MTATQVNSQTHAEGQTRRQFEVASIKPNNSGRSLGQNNPMIWAGGRFTATNVTLVDIIVRVYPTRRIQMRGGPGWIDTDRFDIVAKADDAEGEVKPEQRNGMVQTLLEEQFQLKMHVEKKEMDVFALVPNKGGPKGLQVSKEGTVYSLVPGERGALTFTRTPMATLVNVVSNSLRTPVVDETGISGYYDFTLEPSRYAFIPDREGAGRGLGRGQALIDALEEQLGLKLEKRKTNLDITIIDQAQKPPQ